MPSAAVVMDALRVELHLLLIVYSNDVWTLICLFCFRHQSWACANGKVCCMIANIRKDTAYIIVQWFVLTTIAVMTEILNYHLTGYFCRMFSFAEIQITDVCLNSSSLLLASKKIKG